MTELLAPAGSLEALRAAVDAGADAVYIGGRLFGARAYADNPDEPELMEGIEYCHLRGRKIYLTVNTLLKENELRDTLIPFLDPLYRHGLDALIVQDIGVMRFVRERYPDLELHASTQMSITTPEGALWLAGRGVSRVVPARELSLDEIKAIVRTGIEVETFVHGAMCYCYSGRCLLSSMLGGRSGNRGRCAQPCRLPYTAEIKNNPNLSSAFFPLSMKDMNTLDILPDLIDAGIASFKIEGRMKRPEYSAGVTAVYRKYMDSYSQNGRSRYRVEESDRNILSDLFDRGGFSHGYYRCYNGAQMIVKQRPKEDGAEEGWQKNRRNQTLLFKENSKVKINGSLRIYPDTPVILELWPAQSGKDERFRVRVTGGTPLTARTNAATPEEVSQRIKKTGDSPFEFERLDIALADGLFLPVRMLNELRREALRCLQEKILQERSPRNIKGSKDGSGADSDVSAAVPPEIRTVQNKVCASKMHEESVHPALTVLVTLPEQLEVILRWPGIRDGLVDTIYFDSMLLGDGSNIEGKCRKLLEASDAFHASGVRCFFAFPPVLRKNGRACLELQAVGNLLKNMDGFLVQTVDELAWVREHAYEGLIAAEDCLYSFNRPAREVFRTEDIARFTVPAELNARELRTLGGDGSELILYGYQPLMQSAQCVRNTVGLCRRQRVSGQKIGMAEDKSSFDCLRDRKNVRFPVMTRCLFCTNTIYNSVPLRLGSYAEEIRKINPSFLRISFTIESGPETAGVLDFYRKVPELFLTVGSKIPDSEGTRGHFKRGVE